MSKSSKLNSRVSRRTVLKGAAIALNVAAETLKDYTDRNSTASAAQPARRRVEIEVE